MANSKKLKTEAERHARRMALGRRSYTKNGWTSKADKREWERLCDASLKEALKGIKK